MIWAWRHLGRPREQCLYETRTHMRTWSFPNLHGRGRQKGLSQCSDWLRAWCFLALHRPRRHSFVVVDEVGEKGADLGAGSRCPKVGGVEQRGISARDHTSFCGSQYGDDIGEGGSGSKLALMIIIRDEQTNLISMKTYFSEMLATEVLLERRWKGIQP